MDEDENYDSNTNENTNLEGHEDECGNEEPEYVSDGSNLEWCIEDGIIINGLVDIVNIDMTDISQEDVGRYDFRDLEVAFLFYSWYARLNGFSPRKDCVLRNKNDIIVQQTFVCSRSGYRHERRVENLSRRRRQRNDTRCGCEAKFRVHIDMLSRRWYVTVFNDEHNHKLLPVDYCSLLPTHRRMSSADIVQIESFTKVGIRPPHIYGALAYLAGGYRKIGFIKKDIYNQIARQNRQHRSDASGAVDFLNQLRSNDPLMYVRHTVDANGRLEHLFWSDGESQMNYKIFGDVLAFDATYRKNKNKMPVVVFSGVNHHNQTIVFATALVSNETEDTYVWLLSQFMHVMNDKAPSSVITDGDLAMKNAIKKVFPCAHHRLCAWHLIRNAISNIGIPDFMPYFKRCMLGDYDVSKFEELWNEMITTFGLQDNNWIKDLYYKREMWATAHIRGHFFAGIRTTSRCEALHSHFGKYVHSRISLTDFVQQFQRCLAYFRFRELEADFQSDYGDVVLETNLRSIERSASKLFTKEILSLVRQMLSKALLIDILECNEMSEHCIYSVTKYRGRGSIWHVSFCPSPLEFRCTCLRMESIGLPCDHIIAILLRLDFTYFPKCLVLNRWSKHAKEAIRDTYTDGSFYWDSHLIARYAYLLHLSKELCDLASREDEDYNHIVELFTNELNKLRLKYGNNGVSHNIETQADHNTLQDPPIVRTKGCGVVSTNTSKRGRRTIRCSTCGEAGHNKRSCSIARESLSPVREVTCDNSFDLPDSVAYDYSEHVNTHMYYDHPESFIPSCSRAYDED